MTEFKDDINPLELSDEDLDKYSPPGEETISEVKEEDEKAEEPETSEEAPEQEEPEQEQEAESEQEELEATEEEPEQEAELKAEDKEEEKPAKKVTKLKDNVDYKAEYERLLAPFKANGKQMQVTGVDDALTLMRMGANYNKKMAALKPNLKLMKMLSNNNLLDEGKLSYLIDVDKKDPVAIAKLLKDSNIDPLDVDTEQTKDYRPKSYTVDDAELELDGILANIRDTDSCETTMDIIGNKWDESSKRVLFSHPHIIEVINDHVASGVYDQINQVVESERMLGRLQGKSDLEAYKEIGDSIQAAGGFNSNPAPNGATPPSIPKPKVKKADPELKKRKMAAATTKSAPTKTIPTDFNPLNMSDEEFEKVSVSSFL